MGAHCIYCARDGDLDAAQDAGVDAAPGGVADGGDGGSGGSGMQLCILSRTEDGGSGGIIAGADVEPSGGRRGRHAAILQRLPMPRGAVMMVAPLTRLASLLERAVPARPAARVSAASPTGELLFASRSTLYTLRIAHQPYTACRHLLRPRRAVAPSPSPPLPPPSDEGVRARVAQAALIASTFRLDVYGIFATAVVSIMTASRPTDQACRSSGTRPSRPVPSDLPVGARSIRPATRPECAPHRPSRSHLSLPAVTFTGATWSIRRTVARARTSAPRSDCRANGGRFASRRDPPVSAAAARSPDGGRPLCRDRRRAGHAHTEPDHRQSSSSLSADVPDCRSRLAGGYRRRAECSARWVAAGQAVAGLWTERPGRRRRALRMARRE